MQSCFAINKEKLLEFGVDYPIHESFGDAVSGKITSGNGDNFLKMLPGMEVSSERILFSNENLFHSLCRSDEFKDLLNSKDYLIEVMLYTRNLFEFQFSCWQQSIKRGGVNEDIETCLLNNPINPHHPLILAWIELSKEFNFKLRIRNYSRHKNDIAPQFFADLLGVEDFPFMPPNANQVNRSLTYAEINFQRVFNSLGIKSRPMSDFVVDQLPSIKASEIKCSREVYDFVRGENIKLFASINKYLDPDEALEIESPEMVTFGEEHSSDYFLNGIERSLASTEQNNIYIYIHISSN